MKNLLPPKRLSILLFAFLFAQVSLSQNVSDYVFSQSTSTYTPISGGTVLASGAGTDDEFYTGIPLGFTFYLGASAYTGLEVSTNGFLILGDAGDFGAGFNYPISGDNQAVISPLGTDIQAQAGSELRYEMLGTSPSRVFVMQWSNFRNYNLTGSYSFQVRLYEGTNRIEFIYGTFSHQGGAGANRNAQVGIKATDTDYLNRRMTTNNWSATEDGTALNSSCRLRSTVLPASGLTFRYDQPESDLTISFSVDNDMPCNATDVNFTVSVANNGPAATTNVALEFILPAGLSFVSANASQGSYNSGTGIWTVGALANSGTHTLQVQASINPDQGGNTIACSAEISASDSEDPNTANNSSGLSLTVIDNTLPAISSISDATLSYNVTSSPIDFTIGDNEGSATALSVTVTSSNEVTVPVANINLSGTDENRSLLITPGYNQYGTSTITVEVSDGVCSSSTSFVVNVVKTPYSNFEEAQIVVGQVDFNTVDAITVSQTIAHRSNNTAVSAKGVLAAGSQGARRVLLWNSVPTTNGEPADVVVGKNDFTSSAAGTSASLTSNVDGVCFSPDGNKLIVADAGNNRVLIWNTIPTTNGQAADVVIGQSNFTNNTSGTAANRFNRPTDVMVSPDGKLFVTDRNNNRILIFNSIPTSNNASANLVIGQTNFTNSDNGLSSSRLRLPWNCSLAPDGRLLVADDGNNRILVFNSVPTSNGAAANLVIGQDDFTSNAGGSGDNRFNQPGVTVSPTGVVAIADYDNNRVLIYNEIPSVNGASANVVLGQPNFSQNADFNDGTGVTGSPSNRNMSEPYGINFDLNERLFVNGRSMHRMMVYGTTPTQTADLALSFASSDASPCMGSPVSYTINVSNNGPVNATNVVALSALPYGFTATDIETTSGTYTSSSGFWNIPRIEVGETVSLTLTGTVNTGFGGSSITAYASIRSENQNDSDFSNNSGSVSVSVQNNTTPTIGAIVDLIMDLNGVEVVDFTISDVESASSSLTISATSSNTALIPNANLSLGGSDGNRTLSISPLADQAGASTITLSVSDGTCTTYLSFEVSVGNVWLGTTTDWHTLSNWSVAIPSVSVSAYIPTSPSGGNFPVISNEAFAKNVEIGSGASLTINSSRTLHVAENYTNYGNASTGNGILLVDGTTQQTVRGRLGNLTVNNASGVQIATELMVNGTLTLTAGNLSIGNTTLTLRNALAGTLSNLITTTQSSLAIEGSGNGISIPSHITELHNLSINNTNGLSLANDLVLNGQLSLVAGNLNLNGFDLALSGTGSVGTGAIAATNVSSLTLTGTGNYGSLSFTPSSVLGSFTINRSSGNVSLSSSISVQNNLQLTAGKITTGANTVFVLNDAENAISGYDENNFVIGRLQREVVAGNTYDFPVGTTNWYQIAQLSIESMDAPSAISCLYTQGMNGSAPTGLFEGGVEITQVLDAGYWTISPDNASATITYSITLRSQNHTNGASEPNNHTVIKRENSASNWQLLGDFVADGQSGSGLDPITASRSNLTGFSDFAVGFSPDSELPVELVYFKATETKLGVRLEWQTATEINNDYFSIEKGYSAEHFESIAEVKGMGDSRGLVDYSYTDYTPLTRTVYYRLRQVDFNGDFAYSPIVKIASKFDKMEISVAPNPVASGRLLSVRLSQTEESPVQIHLLDVQGNQLRSWQFDSGADIPSLQLPSVPSGLYYLQIIQAGQAHHQKVIIK